MSSLLNTFWDSLWHILCTRPLLSWPALLWTGLPHLYVHKHAHKCTHPRFYALIIRITCNLQTCPSGSRLNALDCSSLYLSSQLLTPPWDHLCENHLSGVTPAPSLTLVWPCSLLCIPRVPTASLPCCARTVYTLPSLLLDNEHHEGFISLCA